ncbi:MAG TPA: hypothetical protein VIL35_16195 [Vicinamibacterales bacterium]
MKRSVVVVVAVVVVALAAYMLLFRDRPAVAVAVDLVERLPSAEQRTNVQQGIAISAGEHTIRGETKRGIYMHPASRIIFNQVLIPENARLRVWLAIQEEAWDKESDGVLFRFGVDDGREYEELLNQHLDPAHNANDRRWVPVDIDLSTYAGQQVKLIFNTNTSLPGRGDNPSYDFAVWGEPAIVVQP